VIIDNSLKSRTIRLHSQSGYPLRCHGATYGAIFFMIENVTETIAPALKENVDAVKALLDQ
jgi:hypothetical protein